jgi:hypothetical protein
VGYFCPKTRFRHVHIYDVLPEISAYSYRIETIADRIEQRDYHMDSAGHKHFVGVRRVTARRWKAKRMIKSGVAIPKSACTKACVKPLKIFTGCWLLPLPHE